MFTMAFIPSIGPIELLVILALALLLFGRRTPEIARSIGKGITEFRRGLQDPDTDHGHRQLGEPLSSTLQQSDSTPLDGAANASVANNDRL